MRLAVRCRASPSARFFGHDSWIDRDQVTQRKAFTLLDSFRCQFYFTVIMDTVAVVLEKPEHLTLSTVALNPPAAGDVVVDVEWSGISTGTERLLWSGSMPPFPGLGYPLVPGYESVGVVSESLSDLAPGTRVFVPGANCFGDVKGLFGGAASRLVTAADRVIPIENGLGEQGVLLALAATAQHALVSEVPDLIVGHGVLGRLLARLSVARGGTPVVWETDDRRSDGAQGYRVVHPRDDERRDYRCIADVSGDASILDDLISRVAPGGEIVFVGFYRERLSFDFAPAFMREARFRIAAEWKPEDLASVHALVSRGDLSLDGLITHRRSAREANLAYPEAFGDPACLKMLLDWRELK